MLYNINMNTYKKIIIVVFMFTGLAVYSFGQVYFGVGGGFYRVGESFPNDNYARSMIGSTSVFSFHYFPEDSSWGGAIHFLSGSLHSGMEWTDDDSMRSLNLRFNESPSSLRLSFAPAFKLPFAQRVRALFSLGPVFSFYNEGTDRFWGWNGSNSYYEALDLGILGNGVIFFNPFENRFTNFLIKSGVAAEWNFFRAERGEMNMEYRKTRSARFNSIRYFSLGLSFYFGIGLMLN